MSRFYRSFEEFAREELSADSRAGWSIDELEIDQDHGGEAIEGEDEEEEE